MLKNDNCWKCSPGFKLTLSGKNKNKKVKGAIKYYKYYNCLSLVPPWLANENLQLSLSKIQENAFLMLTWNAYLLEIDLKIYIYIFCFAWKLKVALLLWGILASSDIFRSFGRLVYQFWQPNCGAQKHFWSLLFSVTFQQKISCGSDQWFH